MCGYQSGDQGVLVEKPVPSREIERVAWLKIRFPAPPPLMNR